VVVEKRSALGGGCAAALWAGDGVEIGPWENRSMMEATLDWAGGGEAVPGGGELVPPRMSARRSAFPVPLTGDGAEGPLSPMRSKRRSSSLGLMALDFRFDALVVFLAASPSTRDDSLI
jgi:hypothetical protein